MDSPDFDMGFEPWIEKVHRFRTGFVHSYIDGGIDENTRLVIAETVARETEQSVAVCELRNGVFMHADPDLAYTLTGHAPDGSDIEEVSKGIAYYTNPYAPHEPPERIDVVRWLID